MFLYFSVIVQIDATSEAAGGSVDEAEQEIATSIANILGDRSLPESNRIWELVRLKLVGVKVRHSVALYFHCLELREVDHLQEVCASGQLKNTIETVFNGLLKTTGNIRVKIEKIAYSFIAYSFNRSRHSCNGKYER